MKTGRYRDEIYRRWPMFGKDANLHYTRAPFPPASTLILCNLRSVKHKIAHLCEMLLENGINLTCLMGTWLKESNMVYLCQLANPGYAIFHLFHIIGQEGDVAIILHESHANYQDHWLYASYTEPNDRLHIFVYWPHSSPVGAPYEVAEILLDVAMETPRRIILEDFNIHTKRYLSTTSWLK